VYRRSVEYRGAIESLDQCEWFSANPIVTRFSPNAPSSVKNRAFHPLGSTRRVARCRLVVKVFFLVDADRRSDVDDDDD
jgi:hypothetical protein